MNDMQDRHDREMWLRKQWETPLEVNSVGDMLKKVFMANRDMSSKTLATLLGIPEDYLTDVINNRRDISESLACSLATLFQVTPQFWLDHQRTFNKKKE